MSKYIIAYDYAQGTFNIIIEKREFVDTKYQYSIQPLKDHLIIKHLFDMIELSAGKKLKIIFNK